MLYSPPPPHLLFLKKKKKSFFITYFTAEPSRNIKLKDVELKRVKQHVLTDSLFICIMLIRSNDKIPNPKFSVMVQVDTRSSAE